MARVLGFNGGIGSGKSAASEQLHRIVGQGRGAHFEFSNVVLTVGDAWMQRLGIVEVAGSEEIAALRSVVADTYGITITKEQADNLAVGELDAYLSARTGMAETELPVTVDNKERHRPLLQWLGYQMLTRVDGRFWARTVQAQVTGEWDRELVTVGGVRHPADFDAIHELNGHVVEVIRPGAGNDLQAHPSEGGPRPGDIDTQVLNDSDLTALNLKMNALWTDLSTGQPAPNY
jgi:hypothetical protein